ncbi:MAG: TIGR01777 family oxidoreductase [Pirellula sp.]|nr:TIGR01777 family oxidoreductase [Pirellula sp.]
MKIVIPGGSGQLGTILARELIAQKHEVIVLSRKPYLAPWPVVLWDAKNLGGWQASFDNADVVINLAGRSVNCRYSQENRRQILNSRVDATRVVGKAISNASTPPRVWLQTSTATIYSHRFDSPNDDIRGLLGGNEPNVPDTWKFSIDVARAWEQAAEELDLPGTRRVLMRAAMTMSPEPDGVFAVLVGLVKRGLGGTNGDGRQYVSWIHEFDFIRSVFWLIDHDLSGPVNLASPNPLPNADFMRILRKVSKIPIGLPATRWMLEIGAILLKTETELILKSRRVVPSRLLASGFKFQFPTWEQAAEDLMIRWNSRRLTC